jgi:hypothetical protein
MTNKTYYKLAAIIFLIVALGHLVRIINGWEAVINDVEIPMWISVAAVLIAGYLSYRGFTTKNAK